MSRRAALTTAVHAAAPPSLPPPQRIVRCPTCGGPSVYAASNPSRPFCGERCKNIDFGAWASEAYRVAAPPGRPGADARGDDDAPDEDAVPR